MLWAVRSVEEEGGGESGCAATRGGTHVSWPQDIQGPVMSELAEACALSVAVRPQEEVRMPLQSGEGPICLIMGPSRELVRQIHEVVQTAANTLAADPSTRYPEIRVALVTGGRPKISGF